MIPSKGSNKGSKLEAYSSQKVVNFYISPVTGRNLQLKTH